MKFLIGILLLGMTFRAFAVNTPKQSAPKYNTAAEAVYRGTVEDLRDRQCPVSGGVGSHIILKLEDGSTIEVHLATAEFTRMVDMNVHKGDAIEVTGWKLEFEGLQTIFAREVRHGNETYVFRAQDGTPAWMY
jgi:hypothetical protein